MADDGVELVHNHLPASGATAGLPEKIIFWDETLRDGEQTPGVSFSAAEKLQLAKLLDDIGIGIIDVGLPVVSEGEFASVRAIAREGLGCTVLGAARTILKDIQACVDAEVDETSIFVACSDLHLKYKLKKTRQEVIDLSVECVQYAKEHGLAVSFVTEDTVRADIDYAVALNTAAIEAGADRIVLCDTVGVMVPAAVRWWVGTMRARLPKVQLSWHGHNDFGMGVANTLAALESGVEIPHTTINGIGERSGNAVFDEVVMALELLYDKRTGIKVDRLYGLSRLVEDLTGIPLAIQKPIVGYNAFSHESGIHTDGILKHTLTYEPIDPKILGRERSFIFGKHTGTAAIAAKLSERGVQVDKPVLLRLAEEIKVLAEGKEKERHREWISQYRHHEALRRGISDDEFWSIATRLGLGGSGLPAHH